MSTSVLEALPGKPGKPDIKRHSPCILDISAQTIKGDGNLEGKCISNASPY